MHPQTSIDALSSDEALADRLREATRLRAMARMLVGVVTADRFACLALDKGVLRDGRNAHVALGCMTKALTASLAETALNALRVSEHAEVRSYLPTDVDGIGGITFRHLWDHTHGLDASYCQALRRTDRGRIDLQHLLDLLVSAPKIAPPGRLHCYSNVGAWLTAGALEQLSDESYATLLLRMLIQSAPGGRVPDDIRVGDDACPASGYGIEMTAATLASFIRSLYIDSRQSKVFGGEHGDIAPLPGWSGGEQGVFKGWKYYGDGWFGHSSIYAGAYGALRLHPQRKSAVFAFSPDQYCASVASALFGKIVPGFAPNRIPRRLSRGACVNKELYVGEYRVGATRLNVDACDSGELCIRAYARTNSGYGADPFYAALLQPATDEIFYTEPRHPELFPYLQFVRDGSNDYLWNGRLLWPRASKE